MMKIATWNAYRHNTQALEGIAVLMGQHDVLCLQEVHHDILQDVLKYAPYHHTSDECTWKTGRSYIVTLSKHPISNAQNVRHRHWPSLSNWLQQQTEGRFFHHIDILKKGKSWRIINAHLPLSVSPFCRMREWARLWRHTAKHGRTLICGDFNAFHDPFVGLFVAPFMGHRLKDFLIHERRRLRTFLSKKKFGNPFAPWRTQMHLPYQLDFILHSEALITHNALRWQGRLGSDHWPLSAEFKAKVLP